MPNRTRPCPGAGDNTAPEAAATNAPDAAAHVSDEIDRDAWAALLSALLAGAGLSSPERAAAPAGPVDANWRTIRNWLSKSHGVTPGRVRDVARAMGYPPARALVEVGFLRPDELGVVGLAPTASDPALHPLAREVNAALTNRRLAAPVRELLQRHIQFAHELWIDAHRTGAAPKDPGGRRARAEQGG